MDLLSPSDAFYQYPAHENCRHLLRFYIDTAERRRFFQFSTLVMGCSVSSFIVQAFNELVVAGFSLKEQCYARCYSDDFFMEKTEACFIDYASEFGLRFKREKTVEGSTITILGISVNLRVNHASLDSNKAAALAAEIQKWLGKVHISPKSLASLAGKIEFASRVSKSGRSKTFYINKLLSKADWTAFSSRDRWLESDEETVVISLGAKRELEFWSSVDRHSPLGFGEVRRVYAHTLSSDASGSRFGFTVAGRFCGGSFPDSVMPLNIAQKEAYALKRLTLELTSPNTVYNILVDNTTVASAFAKGRSSDRFIHDTLAFVKEFLMARGSIAHLTWISTHHMHHLADAPSRNFYPRDLYGLSTSGASRLLHKLPELAERRANDDLVSLFGGPSNNPLSVPYFSLHVDQDDVLCRQQDAFSALQSKKEQGLTLDGGIFAFPPKSLVGNFLRLVSEIGLGHDSALFLIVSGDQRQAAFNSLYKLGILSWGSLCSGRAKGWLWKQPGHNLVWFQLVRD